MAEKQWWEPELTDADWIARIRADYPEKASDMTDEELRDYYADGQKYATTWDNLGDAYAQFERLADAYLRLQSGKSGG